MALNSILSELINAPNWNVVVFLSDNCPADISISSGEAFSLDIKELV